MKFEDRLARRRQLALIEAQGLVSLHRIGPEDLAQLERDLERRRLTLAKHIDEVRSLMVSHGISLDEVLDHGHDDASRITHRHPVTGETWSGLGSQPQWLRYALLTEGYRPGDLRVSERSEVDEAQSL